jgi:hypothetical protein
MFNDHMVGYDKKMRSSMTMWLDMTRKLGGGDLVGFNVDQRHNKENWVF